MKRASLKDAKVPVTSSLSPDVTDRILAEDSAIPGPAPAPDAAAGAGRAAAVSPAVPAAPSPAVTTSASQPPGPEAQDSGPDQAASSPAALQSALDSAGAAVRALHQAARDEPARYDLAIRYRLDALAHHLEQVSEFISGRLGR
jgi:hypothetical protein